VQVSDIGEAAISHPPQFQIEYFKRNRSWREWIEVSVIVPQAPIAARLFCTPHF